MKKNFFLIVFCLVACAAYAQTTTSATGANGSFYISIVKQPQDMEAMAFELTSKLSDRSNKLSFTVTPRAASTRGDIRLLPEDRRLTSRNDLIAGLRLQEGKFLVYDEKDWSSTNVNWEAGKSVAVEFTFNFAAGNYRIAINGNLLPVTYKFRPLQAKPGLSASTVFGPSDNIGIMGVACADGGFDIRAISAAMNNLVDNDAMKNLKETNPVINTNGTRTFLVGPTRKYQKAQDIVLELKPGDTVLIDAFDGDYPAPLTLTTNDGTPGQRITIKGVRVNGKRPVVRSAGANHPVYMGAKYYILEGIAFKGHLERALAVRGKTIADLRAYFAGSRPGERGPNDSPPFISSDAISYRGIRLDGADHLIIRDCEVFYNYQGIQGMHGNLTIEYSDIHSNAISNQSHNLYLHSEPGTIARIQYNYIHEPFHPMNGLKTRAARNEVYYNYFYNNGQAMELISNNTATLETPFDSDVVGNVIVSDNPRCTFGMRMAGDQTGPGTYGRYRLANNTFVFLHKGRATMLRLNEIQWVESVEMYNNLFYSMSSDTFTVFSTSVGKWVAGGRIVGANNWISKNVTQASIPGTEEFMKVGWEPGTYDLKGTIYGDDPGFTKPNGTPMTGLDLSLRAGSPLIGAGVPSNTLKEWPAFEGGRAPFKFISPSMRLNRHPINPALKDADGFFKVTDRCEKKIPDIGAYGICP